MATQVRNENMVDLEYVESISSYIFIVYVESNYQKEHSLVFSFPAEILSVETTMERCDATLCFIRFSFPEEAFHSSVRYKAESERHIQCAVSYTFGWSAPTGCGERRVRLAGGYSLPPQFDRRG